MTKNEAIKYPNVRDDAHAQHQLENLESYYHKPNDMTKGQRQSLLYAIEILKEKEMTGDGIVEYYTPCRYCQNHINKLTILPCGNGDLGARVELECGDGPVLQIYVSKDVAAGYIEINYCPMCGRRLK